MLAYDVLEHLYDPWSATRALVPGGRFHLSVPNARSKHLWLPLVREGRFRYEPEGILDVTHLRFFARKDAIEMVEAAGLEVVRPPAARDAQAPGRERAHARARDGVPDGSVVRACYSPRRLTTCPSVRSRILMSSQSDQFAP